MHLVSWLICSFRVRTYSMLTICGFPRYCKCVDLSNVAAEVANFQCCKCSSAFKCCNIVEALKCYREEKIMFANATEPTGVAEFSMLRSFAEALKIVADFTEFSKCCERAGFFRVLQYEILVLKRLTPVVPGDSRSWESQKRRTMFGGYLFNYCCVKYQTFHQVCEKASQ